MVCGLLGDIASLSYNPRVLIILEVGPVGFVLSQPYYALDADVSATQMLIVRTSGFPNPVLSCHLDVVDIVSTGCPQTDWLEVCGCWRIVS